MTFFVSVTKNKEAAYWPPAASVVTHTLAPSLALCPLLPPSRAEIHVIPPLGAWAGNSALAVWRQLARPAGNATPLPEETLWARGKRAFREASRLPFLLVWMIVEKERGREEFRELVDPWPSPFPCQEVFPPPLVLGRYGPVFWKTWLQPLKAHSEGSPGPCTALAPPSAYPFSSGGVNFLDFHFWFLV